MSGDEEFELSGNFPVDPALRGISNAMALLRAVAEIDQKVVVEVGVMLYMYAECATEGNPRTVTQIMNAVEPLGNAHRQIKCWFEALEIRRQKNEAERN